MAKGKPNLAFLEALKHEKRRRGDSSTGGAFKTPDWFNKTPAAPAETPKVAVGPAVANSKGFRVTYLHAAIAGMVVIGVVSGAFLAGRRTPQAAPPQANVIETPSGQAAIGHTPSAPTPSPRVPAPVQPSALNNAPATPGARAPGMLYVVFQSYKDEKLAAEARDALVAGGLGATVEKGLDYAPTWYVVVGTQGFARTSAPEYAQYLARTKAISEKFAGKNKWKQFEPNAYKWKSR